MTVERPPAGGAALTTLRAPAARAALAAAPQARVRSPALSLSPSPTPVTTMRRASIRPSVGMTCVAPTLPLNPLSSSAAFKAPSSRSSILAASSLSVRLGPTPMTTASADWSETDPARVSIFMLLPLALPTGLVQPLSTHVPARRVTKPFHRRESARQARFLWEGWGRSNPRCRRSRGCRRS